MKGPFIIQFVGFTTSLRPNEFVKEWDLYAKRYPDKPTATSLLQQSFTRSRFNYVSKHHWPIDDFQFSFTNKRRSDFFHEQHVKVVQAGGYVELGKNFIPEAQSDLLVILAFIDHNENDFEYYDELKHVSHLNKYQAFYENCLFGRVYEFFTTEENWPSLLAALKMKKGNESGLYRGCGIAETTAFLLDEVPHK